MKINILHGDITAIRTGAIVNAANSSLLGGGGVDGAIHRKGGPEILSECMAIRNRQGGCKTGEAVITTAGLLPAEYVIHTVGPVWNGGRHDEDALLKSCYDNSLRLALEHQIRELSFPNISTGIYGFPKERAARIVWEIFTNLPQEIHAQLDVINLVCYDSENLALYQQLFSNAG